MENKISREAAEELIEMLEAVFPIAQEVAAEKGYTLRDAYYSSFLLEALKSAVNDVIAMLEKELE